MHPFLVGQRADIGTDGQNRGFTSLKRKRRREKPFACASGLWSSVRGFTSLKRKRRREKPFACASGLGSSVRWLLVNRLLNRQGRPVPESYRSVRARGG